jgi:membrane-associated phospholipid phosphatase
MFAFGLALPIFLRERKIGISLLILAFLVGFSMIYCGFHTPFDVLAGILFSSIFVLLFEKILR